MAQNKEFVDQHNKFLVEKVEKIKEIEKMNRIFEVEATSLRRELEDVKDRLGHLKSVK